ncbi:MAG TPA: HAMP domain-containing sensor histidine kinase [Anaeromyxobacteraceae bacterium]|nr:HAMP domain-containing sensor histidine kinase [Anaeromyxobacteraceae bacterium]
MPGIVATGVSGICGYAFLATSADAQRVAGALLGTALFLPVACLIAGIGAVVRAGFTERERAARELASALHLRDQFIATASHELRTPLTSLSLTVQQMKRGPRVEHTSSAERRIQALQRQTERLARLVNGLLDVSTIVEGRLRLHVERFDLSEAVRTAAEAYEEDSAHAGNTLVVDAPPGIVGEWDRLRVEQIVGNLISNAVKYGRGRPIHVSVRAGNGNALIVVKDEGIGIPRQDQDRIFQRFERVERGPGYSGFGLGLWIVREFAAAMDGTVRVESEAEHGAAFTVVLPRRDSTGQVD